MFNYFLHKVRILVRNAKVDLFLGIALVAYLLLTVFALSSIIMIICGITGLANFDDYGGYIVIILGFVMITWMLPDEDIFGIYDSVIEKETKRMCPYKKQHLFHKNIENVCKNIAQHTYSSPNIGAGRIQQMLNDIRNLLLSAEKVMSPEKYEFLLDKTSMYLDPYLKYLQVNIVKITSEDEERIAGSLQKIKDVVSQEVQKI